MIQIFNVSDCAQVNRVTLSDRSCREIKFSIVPFDYLGGANGLADVSIWLDEVAVVGVGKPNLSDHPL